jgi:methyl-accepting chemotaxis protein
MVGERDHVDDVEVWTERGVDESTRRILSRYSADAERLASLGNGQSLRDVGTVHLDEPTAEAERLAGRYRDAGVDASTFVASHGPAVEGLVAAASGGVRDRLEADEAVLDEVKSLATETSEHTDRIPDNIAAIQDRTAEPVDAVEASHERVAVVEARVSDAIEALDDIADAAEEDAMDITEVADANDEQAATIEGITNTVEEVHHHAEEAEAAVDDIAEATERQAAVVDDLHERVEDLTTG